MPKTDLAKLTEQIGQLANLVVAQNERIGALETAPQDAEPVVAHVATPVTRLPAQDAEIQRLRLAVPKEAKAKLIDQCAAHSYDALNTLILAGGRDARAFMKGEGPAATKETDFHLVYDHANGLYACKLLEQHEALPVTAHSARAKRETGMNAGMTDAQLYTFRPADASTKYAARHAWLKRTRANLA